MHNIFIIVNRQLLLIGQQDFDSQSFQLYFFGSKSCHHLHINIVNDEINEAEKQVFIMKLTLDKSRNPDLITLFRNVSLGIIIDDDRKLLSMNLTPNLKTVFPTISY